MSKTLEEFRKLNPDDTRSDLEVIALIGDQWKQEGVDFSGDEEFSEQYKNYERAMRPGLLGEFKAGVARGVDQTQSTYYGGLALAGDTIDVMQGDRDSIKVGEGLRDWAMEGYQRNQQEAQENAASVQSYKDVDSIGDAATFVAGLGGEVLPSGAEAIVSGMATGGVGAPIAKQFAKRQIRKTLANRVGREVASEALQATQERARNKLIKEASKKGFARASALGTGASSVLQSAGETYGELYDSAATQGDRIKASLAAGLVAGALDSVVPITVLRRIFPASVAKNMTEDQIKKQGLEAIGDQLDKAFEGYAPLKRKFIATLVKDTGNEAITESLQELVQEAAQAYADPDYKYDPAALRERLINAAIAGAVGGTQFGGASATIDTYRQSGVNKHLNNLSATYDELLLAQRRADRGEDISLDSLNEKIRSDNAGFEPISIEAQDLLAYVESQDAGGEGAVGALVKYQDPDSGEWRNAYVRGESTEQIVKDLTEQGVKNAELVEMERSGPLSVTKETAPVDPTPEEIKAAEAKLKKDKVKKADFSEEDWETVVVGAVEDSRERVTIGKVPDVPEQTKETILQALAETTAEIDADESLSPDEKIELRLDAELEVRDQLESIGEEFDSDDIAEEQGKVDKTKDQGTNTPEVATESGQVTASPVFDPDPDDVLALSGFGITLVEYDEFGKATNKPRAPGYRIVAENADLGMQRYFWVPAEIKDRELIPILDQIEKNKVAAAYIRKKIPSDEFIREMASLYLSRSGTTAFRQGNEVDSAITSLLELSERMIPDGKTWLEAVTERAAVADVDVKESTDWLVGELRQRLQGGEPELDSALAEDEGSTPASEVNLDGIPPAPEPAAPFKGEVHHISSGRFAGDFDFSKASKVDVVGAFFSPKRMANYESKGGDVIVAEVEVRNPVPNKYVNQLKSHYSGDWGMVTQALKQLGFDGIIRGDKEVVAFGSPSQIKIKSINGNPVEQGSPKPKDAGSTSSTGAIALDQKYSNLEFMPAESLVGLSLEDNLAAGRTDFDSEGNRVKGGKKAKGEKGKSNNKFTRRAVVLQNTVTGEVEVRGSYSAGLSGKKGDAGRVQQIQLHGEGDSKRSGMKLVDAVSGWEASDYKKGQASSRKVTRPPHRVLGILEFAGRPAPYDAEDQAFFDEIKEKQRKGDKISKSDLDKISGIASRSGGYGNIFEVFSSEDELNSQIGSRVVDPKETQAEKVARGKIQLYRPGEYLENLESVSQRDGDANESAADESAADTRAALLGDDDALDDAIAEEAEVEVFQLSEQDTELIDPEALFVDEPANSDPQAAMRTLAREHGMPAPEVEQALDELESIESDGSLADIREVMSHLDDYPVLESFLSLSDEPKYHFGRIERLIQSIYASRSKNSTQGAERSDGRDPRGTQAPVQNLPEAERESRRAQVEGAGDAQAVSGQEGDGATPVQERERQRPDADPSGDRTAGERILDWNAIKGGHVAYAGDLVFSVSDGPQIWDLRISNTADETVLYSETFVGNADAAILAIEAALTGQLQKPGSEPATRAAENAAPSVERPLSGTQPAIELPADKPKLVAIQGDRVPDVTDRIGDRYDLDAVGKQGVNLSLAAHENGRPGFLNSDGTGVGKSRQAIAVMNELQEKTGGRILYVTENASQITKFKREMRVMGVSNPRIEFTTYKQIGLGKMRSRAFAAVVYDEAHNLKNSDSDKASNATYIKSGFTMFMTATPMDKVEAAAYFVSTITGQDRDSVLNQLGMEVLVNERKDGSLYDKIQKQKGVTNGDVRMRLNELRNKLISDGAMIRREYPFYGDRDVIPFDLNEEQQAELDEINNYWDAQESDSRRNQDINRWLEGQKEDEIYERAKDDLANGRSVVIVAETINAQWIEALEGQTKKAADEAAGGKGKAKATRPHMGLGQRLAARFEADGINHSKIYGTGDKTKAVDAFQSGENKLAIMSPKSGGAGIDLDDQTGNSPRSVYVATMNFSGDVFEQIMGRFSRRNTMSPTKLSFVTASKVSSELHRAAILTEKLATLSTFQGKQAEDQDSDIRDIFSESMLNAPATAEYRLSSEARPIQTFNFTALPESRINTLEGIDYEIQRITRPSPFLIDKHIDDIAREFGADARARVLIRNILEAIPGEKLQTLDLRIVDNPDLPAGAYDPDRRLLLLNKAATLNRGNGIALGFTHEMGHFYVNEVIGFDFVKDQWQSLSDKKRAAAWKQYLDAQGIYAADINGADLKFDDTAAQEWAAFQFTRIAREGLRGRDKLTSQMRKEGVNNSLIDSLTQWYDQLRKWISDWIGDADLSTTELDNAVMNALGIESDESSMRADAKRQGEYLATIAAKNGYANANDFAIEDLQGYAKAAREYRESKSIFLNAPSGEPKFPDDLALDRGPLLTYSLPDGTTTTENKSDPRGNLIRSIARQKRGYVSRGGRSPDAQKRSQLALERWSDAQGLVLDRESFEAFKRGKQQFSGSEHEVYYDKSTSRVVKVTHQSNGNFGHSVNALDYLYEIAASNKLFDDDVRLEGIIGSGPDIQIVTSQPFVKGRDATRPEIITYLTKELGLKKNDDGDYVGKGGVSVSDIATVNAKAYEGEDGSITIQPIDFQVSAPDGYLGEYEGMLMAPAGHRNKDIQKKLKDTDVDRAADLIPETTGRSEAGAKIVAENAWAAHGELRDIAMEVYDVLRQSGEYREDFDTFYRKYTATPVSPSEAHEYISGLDSGMEDVTRADLDEDRQRNVDGYILVEIYEAHKKLNASRASDKQSNEADQKVIERETAKLEKVQAEYNNAEVLERGAVDDLKDLLREFKKALGAKGSVAKLGKLGEVIRQLEGKKELDNRIARKYTLGIERLIQSEEPFVLFDLLEAVAESEIKLTGKANTVRNRFAEAGIDQVSALSDSEFAAVIAIAQTDRKTLDAIILRKLPDAAEKIAIVESEVAETKGDFKRSSKAIQKIQKHAALKGRIAGERALVKGKITRLKNRIAKREAEAKIREQVAKHYEAKFNEMLGRAGATIEGHVVEGTALMIPATPESSKLEIMAGTKQFRHGETKAAEITAIVAAQKEWLDGASAEENRLADPWFYNQVRTQNARLVQRMVKDHIQTKANSMSRNWYMDSLSNSFDKLNMTAGRSISQMLNQFISMDRAYRNETQAVGERADTLRSKLANELGYDKTPMLLGDRFKREIDTPMKRYMENPGADINTFIRERFPKASDKAKRLMREYDDVEIEFGKLAKKHTNQMISIAGLGAVTNDRVLAPDYSKDGELTAIEQTHRNLGTGNYLIAPNRDALESLYKRYGNPEAMRALIDTISNEEIDDQATYAAVNEFFNDKAGYDLLIGELARKEGVPVFSQSSGGGLIKREDAIQAYEDSSNAAEFFTALYEQGLEFGDLEMSLSEYMAEQMGEVLRLYSDVAKTQEKFAESLNSPISAEGHVGIDARKGDAWPTGWIEYRMAGATANHIILNKMVKAAVFGKGGQKMKAEQDKLISQINAKILDASESGNIKLKKQLEGERHRIQGMHKQIDIILGSEEGPLKDHKTAMEAMGSLVGGVLAGPRSAMVQLNQLYQAMLMFGLSGTTVRMSAGLAKRAGQDLFGSIFQAFGVTLWRNSEAFNEQVRLYGRDADTQTGFTGSWYDIGVDGDMSNTQRWLRRYNNLMRRGFSRVKAEDAIYSAAKPHNPFAWLMGGLNKSPMMVFRDEFDRLAAKAIEFADAKMPDGGDLTKLKFDAKALGYKGFLGMGGDTEFGKLNRILEEKVGTTLADVVAHHRANKGGKPFTDMQYQIMGSVGLDILASESNVFTTRSPIMHTRMGRFIFPLIGWSLQQPHVAAQMFKGADGEVNKRTITAGIMTLGFGLVPAVMMMAVFEDWFDEEIMNKKRNLRPLVGGGISGGATAVLERVTRNGMLGMPMEMINLGMNLGSDGDLRAASLDQRIFLASSIRNMIQITGSVMHQGTLEGQKRRILAGLGANGFLQQIDAFNSLLDLDNAESRIIARINANNYLKVGGRMIGIEMRNFSGSITPTKMTPWVTKMQIAAQSNDGAMFQKAYQRALKAAREDLDKTGPREAEDYVALNWNSRHPLKGAFKSPPTPQEYQQILLAIGEAGANDVQELVNNYNAFGQRIGAKPYVGKASRSGGSSATLTMRDIAGI